MPEHCERLDFVEVFETWAFGWSREPDQGLTKLIKWVDPIVFLAIGDGVDYYEKELEKITLELSVMTNHPIFYSRTYGNSLLFIAKDPVETARSQEQYSEILDQAFPEGLDMFEKEVRTPRWPFCEVKTYGSDHYNKSDIVFSVIFVDTRFSGDTTRTCLRMMMSGALGIVAHLKESECTLFQP